MPTYIALRLLDAGPHGYIQPRTRTMLEWLGPEDQLRLVQRGAVRQIESPPLKTLAGWSRRAQRLEAIEITTAEEFLEADPNWIASELNVKPETATKWASEIEAWLTVSPPVDRS